LSLIENENIVEENRTIYDRISNVARTHARTGYFAHYKMSDIIIKFLRKVKMVLNACASKKILLYQTIVVSNQ